MNELRRVKNKADQEKFQKVTSYCFIDSIGWIPILFPLPRKKDYILGSFNQDQNLESGIISRSFETNYFNRKWDSTGISCVVSDPSARNKGTVRDLMNKMLIDDKKDGAKMSYLYPFSFRFYQKFGYGTLGPRFEFVFGPSDIRENREKSLQLEPFDWSKSDFNSMVKVYNKWTEDFSGAIPMSEDDYSKTKEMKEAYNYHYYAIKNNADEIESWIAGKIEYGDGGPTMTIVKAAWVSPNGLSAIFNYLWSHRGQIFVIKWSLPSTVPVKFFMTEPRIDMHGYSDRMGRPLDVVQTLQAKLDMMKFDKKVTFSIIDPVIEENTGTYKINGTKIEKIQLNNKNLLEFHYFSSLMLGGVNYDELYLAGLIPEIENGEHLFTRDYSIHITETF